MAKTDNRSVSDYPINFSLCVIPTEKESQYEAFQSIFAHILSAHIPPIVDVSRAGEMSTYELLCAMSGIILTDNRATFIANGQKGIPTIYFESKEVTHYISTNGDPYINLQANKTQGFCQMFAYFVTMGQVHGFYRVVQDKLDTPGFLQLAFNTYFCGLKLVNLIYTSPQNFLAKFSQEFDAVVSNPKLRKKFGIQRIVSLQQFVDDFAKLSFQDAIYYLFDQQLVGVSDNSVLANGYIQNNPLYETDFNILEDSIPHQFYAHKPLNVRGGKRRTRSKIGKLLKTKRVKKTK